MKNGDADEAAPACEILLRSMKLLISFYTGENDFWILPEL